MSGRRSAKAELQLLRRPKQRSHAQRLPIRYVLVVWKLPMKLLSLPIRFLGFLQVPRAGVTLQFNVGVGGNPNA
jgi:hypothetical protein